MSERMYDRLANVFMLIAVGSALLFDSASAWHIAVGSVGLAAGVSAVVLYFTNQQRNIEKADAPQIAEESQTREVPDQKNHIDIAVGENWTALVAEWEKYAIGTSRRTTLKTMHFYAHHGHHTVPRPRNRQVACWYLLEDRMPIDQQEVSLSPNDVAACAIEIIRNLSSGADCDRWEFSFGPDGLRVSAKNSPDHPQELPQQDFDFGQMSKMIN